jgi:glycosyltransferase involved in cell wall biosynthesis
LRTANGVDAFIANSAFIARRIRKVYRREAEVIFPPVDLDRFAFNEHKEDFYLAASRMVPYKKMPLIAQAFAQMPDKRLVMIGDGPEIDRVRALAGPNVTVLGYQGTDVLADHMQRARAFVFAAEEDFGIMPVEVQACGTPVIAFGRGGATETVITEGPHRTGIFFNEQTVASMVDAVTRLEQGPPCLPADCRANAERFSVAAFRTNLQAAVTRAMTAAAA